MSEVETYDVLIFGSGTGGKLTAWTSASEGLRTAVVECRYVGGSCPNIACLPTKNVVHSAKVADFVRHDRDFGSGTAAASTEMAEVRARKRRMGPQAAEVIAVVQTAMMGKLPYTALRDAPFTHPTIAEGLGPLFSGVPARTQTSIRTGSSRR